MRAANRFLRSRGTDYSQSLYSDFSAPANAQQDPADPIGNTPRRDLPGRAEFCAVTASTARHCRAMWLRMMAHASADREAWAMLGGFLP